MTNEEEGLPELKKRKDSRKREVYLSFVKAGFFIATFIAVVVAVAWSFGWVAIEKYNREELFEKYQNSRPESRSLICVEWLRMLSLKGGENFLPTSLQTHRLLQDLDRLQMAESSDRNLAAPLVSILGFSQEAETVAPKIIEFAEKIPSHQGLEAQVAVIFSLGRLGLWSENLKNYLNDQVKDQDSSVRKSVAYILGAPAWPEEYLKPWLLELLGDKVEDVSWNAALSMFRRGYPEGRPVVDGLLAKLWSEAFVSRKAITVDEEELYKVLFKVVAEKKNPSDREVLEKIAKNHPHVKLRRLALEALTD